MTRRERKEARLARRLEWAEGRDKRAAQGFNRARSIADGIPFGQPILVGHHSEGRARRDQARIESGMRAGVESQQMAAHHRSKADGLQHQLDTSIFSDDPDAPERLRERIAGLEAEQDRMKKINRICRKGAGWEARLAEAGIVMTEQEQKVLADVARFQPYYIKNGCPTFPPYALSNLGGNIRRLKDRLAQIEAQGVSNG
jgi:hypothetical protein